MKKIQKIIPLHRKRGVWWLDSSYISEHTRLPSAMLHAFASNTGLSIDCLHDSSVLQKAGHIPGAKSYFWQYSFEGDYLKKPKVAGGGVGL